MASFAFVPTCLPGHVNPTLGVARALVERGHRVTYHLPASFAAVVRAEGVRLQPLAVGERSITAALTAAAGLREDPLRQFRLMPLQLAHVACSVIGPLLAALRSDPPDVLIYDRLCVWGRLAAERLAIRAAMTSASYAINDVFSYLPAAPAEADPELEAALETFAHDMRWMSRAYGVPRLNLGTLLLHVEPLVIVFVPRELQPAAETFDDRHLFVGAVERGVEAADAPPPTRADRPMAYVSLGTLFHRWPAFRTICHDAFADGRWDVVLAGFPPARPRPGMVVREHVPQLSVLRQADVFVTHGGINSALEALRRAVPMVVIPQMPEQAVTARRIAAEGAGRVLERHAVTARSLRAAAEAVHDENHAVAARRLGERVTSGGGASAAADALVGLATGSSFSRAPGAPSAARPPTA